MLTETQKAAVGWGINSKDTITTAIPAIITDVRVPGKTALYCSANCREVIDILDAEIYLEEV